MKQYNTKNDLDKNNERYNLLVVTYEPFPIGMAATNRILSWTGAISKEGVSVKVLILKATEKAASIINISTRGSAKGVDFEYLSGSTVWPFSASRLKKLTLLIRAHRLLYIRIKKHRPLTLVTYTHYYHTKVYLLILRHFFKFRLIIEETEYPKILKKKKNVLFKKPYLASYKRANGMLVMTHELKGYYNSIDVKNVFILPMSVDSSRFSNMKKSMASLPYFTYVGGSGGFSRDGVIDIVMSFHAFSKKHSNFLLKIVGPIDNKNTEVREINKYIQDHHLEKVIHFTGGKATTEIPQILCDATGIILAPPHDYSSGGFPTKLGEFLASGTPVICTSVSSIPLYLNSKNSFLIEAGDIKGIQQSMEEIVMHPSQSKKIGEAGKTCASTRFNVATYVHELKEFIFNEKQNPL